MKIKITNPWIPVTLITIPILSVLVAILVDNELIGNITSILALVFFFLLEFIYFPILIAKLYGDSLPNKQEIVRNIGVFSISFFVIGILFKLFKWPAASSLIIIGGLVFYLSFLPAWYVASFKKNDRFQRLLSFVFATNLGLLICAFQFKTMHWPGGNMLYALTSYTFLYALLPLSLFALLFKRKKKYIPVTQPFIFGFIIAYVIGAIISMKLISGVFSSNSKNQEQVEKNLKVYSVKNNFLYNAFKENASTDSAYIRLKEKTVRLKQLTEETNAYIKELKAYLVRESDGLDSLNPDSVKFDQIHTKAQADASSLILIGGDDQNPRQGRFSALDLKAHLTDYINKLEKLVPEDAVLQFRQSNPISFEDVETEDAQVEKWEIVQFNHQALGTVFTTLTNYQADVKYLEMLVLTELFNRANATNKENMAAQLAELSAKYENEKQEKKINLLQKDQELNEVRMKAKDEEISNREKTIAYFVIALVAFIVLTVFVVRSNLLRKKANKELALQRDIIAGQKEEVEEQKLLVEEKQKEIVDSITYAKRLQEAILPPKEFLDQHIPGNFVLYKPKDLVAGDFYWAEKIGDLFFIAAADSTGHGVPGAMVSVVCSNALNRAVKEFHLTQTGAILDKARELVVETFGKSALEVKDGMDISLLCIDKTGGKIYWSGANNPLWYISEGQLNEIKADKQPIGKTDNPKPFHTHEIAYSEGMIFYLFTDGYADQFGGPLGKKFKYKQLSELLVTNSQLALEKQAAIINKTFEDWKTNAEQVDDVCVIGIRV